MNYNNRNEEDSPVVEWRTKCKVIQTRKDMEALVFSIPLGLLKIICIANIPNDDQDSAPVYIKFKFFEQQKEWTLPFGTKKREEPDYSAKTIDIISIPAVSKSSETPLSQE
jgi:hypothetical protein